MSARRLLTIYLPMNVDTVVAITKGLAKEFPRAVASPEPGLSDVLHVDSEPSDAAKAAMTARNEPA